MSVKSHLYEKRIIIAASLLAVAYLLTHFLFR